MLNEKELKAIKKENPRKISGNCILMTPSSESFVRQEIWDGKSEEYRSAMTKMRKCITLSLSKRIVDAEGCSATRTSMTDGLGVRDNDKV